MKRFRRLLILYQKSLVVIALRTWCPLHQTDYGIFANFQQSLVASYYFPHPVIPSQVFFPDHLHCQGYLSSIFVSFSDHTTCPCV